MPAARVSSATLDKPQRSSSSTTRCCRPVCRRRAEAFVERGGGLLVVARRSAASWPASEADLLPGKLGATVDRTSGARRDARLPRLQPSGLRSLQGAAQRRLLGGARLPLPRARAGAERPRARAVRRRRGGGGGAAGRHRPRHRLDDDARRRVERPAAQTPVYLPLVHQLVKYLARYEQHHRRGTRSAQVVDLSALLKSRADRVVVTPARRAHDGARRASPASLELNEQGVYEVRAAAGSAGRPDRIAVNLDPAESDLAPLDPQELVAAVTGRAGRGRRAAGRPRPRSAAEEPSASRASGGICSSPAWLLLWRPKWWSRTVCRGTSALPRRWANQPGRSHVLKLMSGRAFPTR